MIKLCQECGYPFKIKFKNDKCGSLLCKKINERKHTRTAAMNPIRKLKYKRLLKKYYQEHKEECYQKSREYIKNHPIVKKIYYINWMRKNKNRELKRLREWKRKNKEKHAEMNRRWKQKNNFRLRLYKFKRRSKGTDIKLSKEEWQIILNRYGKRCYYCGCILYKKGERGFIKVQELTIDHLTSINKHGKTVMSNIVPACLSHNSSKRSLSEQEFIEYIRKDTNNPNWKPFGVAVKMRD